jgi:hypothetical protein
VAATSHLQRVGSITSFSDSTDLGCRRHRNSRMINATPTFRLTPLTSDKCTLSDQELESDNTCDMDTCEGKRKAISGEFLSPSYLEDLASVRLRICLGECGYMTCNHTAKPKSSANPGARHAISSYKIQSLAKYFYQLILHSAETTLKAFPYFSHELPS